MLPEYTDSEIQLLTSDGTYAIIEIINGLVSDFLKGILDIDQFLVCLDNMPYVNVEIEIEN